MGKEGEEEAKLVDWTYNHPVPSDAIKCRKLMVLLCAKCKLHFEGCVSVLLHPWFVESSKLGAWNILTARYLITCLLSDLDGLLSDTYHNTLGTCRRNIGLEAISNMIAFHIQ